MNCTVEGCDRPVKARGWCKPHYMEWYNAQRAVDGLPCGVRVYSLPKANPWAGRIPCPQCGSAEWTLPQDPKYLPDDWRCVACHIGFKPSEMAGGSNESAGGHEG